MKKEVLLALFLTIWVTVIMVTLRPFAFDDAYIHFRIAENLAHNFRPYFNLTDRVMSTSSFVWSCLLAVLSKLPFSLPIKVSILSSILVIIGSFIWCHLLRAISKQKVARPLAFAFQMVYIGVLLHSAAGLMETPLALLLLGLSIFLLVTNRPAGWILMGLAIFTRYELAVFAGIFLLIWFFTGDNEQKLKGIALFAVTLVLLSGIIYSFYSTVIPHTVIAKQAVYQISFSNIFNRVLFSLFPNAAYPFLGIPIGLNIQKTVFKMLAEFWKPFLLLVIVVTFLLAIKTRKPTIFKDEFWGVGIFAGGLVIASAYIVKHVFLHGWYVPLFSVPIIFGAYVAALQRQILIRFMALLLSLIPVSNLFIHTYAAFISPSVLPTVCGEIRVQRYLEVGNYLYDTFPNAKLLSSEIGGLGYSFRGEIIDAGGLITPSALKYHPMKIPQQRGSGETGAIPAEFVNEVLPELIVSYPTFVQEFDSSTYVTSYTKILVPAFSRVYQDKTNCMDLWGDQNLYIYIRNDIVTEDVIFSLQQKLDS